MSTATITRNEEQAREERLHAIVVGEIVPPEVLGPGTLHMIFAQGVGVLVRVMFYGCPDAGWRYFQLQEDGTIQRVEAPR